MELEVATRIYTRFEFSKWLNLRDKRLGGKNCVAWSCEPKKHPSLWFVNVRPIAMQSDNTRNWDLHREYWNWCSKNVNGRILGYYCDTDNQIEWWGFTHKEDILPWLLRWS